MLSCIIFSALVYTMSFTCPILLLQMQLSLFSPPSCQFMRYNVYVPPVWWLRNSKDSALWLHPYPYRHVLTHHIVYRVTSYLGMWQEGLVDEAMQVQRCICFALLFYTLNRKWSAQTYILLFLCTQHTLTVVLCISEVLCIQSVPGGMWNTSGECSLC